MKSKDSEESLYIPFSRVAKLLKVKPYVLCYWEKKIPQLKSYRISNRKFYKREQIEILLEVKTLIEKGYTLEGIKKHLQERTKEREKTEKTLTLASVQGSLREKQLEKILKEVLEELKRLSQMLE